MSLVSGKIGNPSARISSLRDLLTEKFPATPLITHGFFPTGFSAFDEAEGGLRKGAITELTGSLGSGGFFIEVALSLLQSQKCYAALVDAGRGFDPSGCAPDALRRFLWIMCSDSKQAIKAADLLLRDANLPLVLLDLQMTGARELRGIPSSTWHRFQRLVEQTGIVFVILSRQPMVEAAQVRITVKNHWKLDAMRQRRDTLLKQLSVHVFPRKQFLAYPKLIRQSA